MSSAANAKLSPPLVSAIQDAVLFGNIKELDGVLDLIEFEADFPAELRHNIEALLYFRMNYGKGGEIEPLVTQTRADAARLEAEWSSKILAALAAPGTGTEGSEQKYA